MKDVCVLIMNAEVFALRRTMKMITKGKSERPVVSGGQMVKVETRQKMRIARKNEQTIGKEGRDRCFGQDEPHEKQEDEEGFEKGCDLV